MYGVQRRSRVLCVWPCDTYTSRTAQPFYRGFIEAAAALFVGDYPSRSVKGNLLNAYNYGTYQGCSCLCKKNGSVAIFI
jgi:hypothetical protein